ncbi:TlyA family RNA methyltransferase [Magnetospira sp. QH-2]|uniref:TlyA family RNA methyltransferase n=1 Tax=Magnetospira sp. (strain QH-2) TaxID=1288970 RepID=UPI0003E80D50|nr:TlyA family RNA methyltransferase [Magnetospira sp. QH-2]CCQ74143.1 Putative hemolysin A, Containing one S4 RNA binding domain [Magnetospira sp. QH-2]
MANPKMRLDQLLVDRGLVESRSKAQALIMAGCVTSESKRLGKPGQQVRTDIPIDINGQDHPWVSRGGLKLAKGLSEFGIDPTGKTGLDLGASTGGFTDVLLNNGATKVYAVDVGHRQLAKKLRTDSRVVVMERTNARYLTSEMIPEPIDLIVCDASFIGLRTLLPAPLALAARGAVLVALIKPQFEVGRERVGKGGVVRDSALHEEVCESIRNWIECQAEWAVLGVTESPIKGPEGNKEFLIAARRLSSGDRST